jgi:hypothetical protein
VAVTLTVKGPFFSARIDQTVKDAIVSETLRKIDERVQRPGRWQQRLGAKRNRITMRQQGLILDIASTTISPRTSGVSWTRKNMGTIRGMLPRVLRKTAETICARLD